MRFEVDDALRSDPSLFNGEKSLCVSTDTKERKGNSLNNSLVSLQDPQMLCIDWFRPAALFFQALSLNYKLNTCNRHSTLDQCQIYLHRQVWNFDWSSLYSISLFLLCTFLVYLHLYTDYYSVYSLENLFV